jgi:hypothetical protein
MTLVDLVTFISTIAAVIAAIYAMLSYHRSKVAAMSETREWRPRMVLAGLAFVAWGAVAFGYYDRHYGSSSETAIDAFSLVHEWGTKPENTFYLTANTKPLLNYKAKYKLVLILRGMFSTIDRMTDTAISKSAPYTITGDKVILAKSNPLLNGHPGENYIEYDLVMIPLDFSEAQITSLADVERIGGKILASPVASQMAKAPNSQ